jgi:hypothetical protein
VTKNITTKSSEDRNKNDHYPTPPWATYALIEHEKKHIDKHVVSGGYVSEPAAGCGWMAAELARHYPVIANDLYEYEVEKARFPVHTNFDFLTQELWPQDWPPSAIITNPPYAKNLAQKFTERALEQAPYVAMLCRLTWAESATRYKFFKANPPTKMLVFSTRFSCNEEYLEGPKAEGGMVAYAWWIWDKNRSGSTIDWIAPGGYKRWKDSLSA